jgi:hypothetical protein
VKFIVGIAIGIVLGPVVEKRYGHIYVAPLKKLLERLEEGSK